MKSDGIRRAVRKQRYRRSPGDAPNLGKLKKMPGTGRPKGLKHRKKRSQSKRSRRLRASKKRILRTWTRLIAGIFLVSFLGLVVFFFKRNIQPFEEDSITKPVVEERVVSKFASPSEAAALGIVQAGLACRKPENVTNYFRTGTATPQQVVTFLSGLKENEGEVKKLIWRGSMDASGLSLDGVIVESDGDKGRKNRVVLLTPDASGRWRIDFDAFARTVTPSWDELIGKQVATARVRVYAAVETYFNGPFADDQQWACFGIVSPDTEAIMYGYCKLGSAQSSALASIFSKSGTLARVFLEIKRVEGAAVSQFEITQVLSEDWVMGPVSFDSKFH